MATGGNRTPPSPLTIARSNKFSGRSRWPLGVLLLLEQGRRQGDHFAHDEAETYHEPASDVLYTRVIMLWKRRSLNHWYQHYAVSWSSQLA